jgi:hypothetical protein
MQRTGATRRHAAPEDDGPTKEIVRLLASRVCENRAMENPVLNNPAPITVWPRLSHPAAGLLFSTYQHSEHPA